MENAILHKCAANSSFEYLFFCEGCGCCHGFRTATWAMPTGMTEQDLEWFQYKWTFNGDLEKPTITPSLHIHTVDKKGDKTTKCHSFVIDGKIEFLLDCNHKLAGQTIDLQPF